MNWSSEHDETLTKLWNEGLSATTIGQVLGVSKNAVVGRAHRIKLPGRPSPIKPAKTAAEQAKAAAARRRRSGVRAGTRRHATASAEQLARRAEVPSPPIKKARQQKSPSPERLANALGLDRRPRDATRQFPTACQWPVGDHIKDPDWRCGADLARPADARCSYCQEHEDIAFDRHAKSPKEEAA